MNSAWTGQRAGILRFDNRLDTRTPNHAKPLAQLTDRDLDAVVFESLRQSRDHVSSLPNRDCNFFGQVIPASPRLRLPEGLSAASRLLPDTLGLPSGLGLSVVIWMKWNVCKRIRHKGRWVSGALSFMKHARIFVLPGYVQADSGTKKAERNVGLSA